MKITKKYGNTIYGDNTISETTTYHFDKIQDLHQFWQDNLDAGMTGNWTAHLDRMTVEHSEFVDAKDYHFMGSYAILNDFTEFCEGEEE